MVHRMVRPSAEPRARRHRDRELPVPWEGFCGVKTKLFLMWQQDERGRVRTPFEPLILAATFLMIPVVIIERDVESAGWRTVGEVANWLIWVVFAVEIAAVLIVAPRKWAALRAHWLDAAVVVVTVPLYGRLLSSLRL